MNNNKKNQYLEMFLNIADELLQEQKIKSRRDFSTRYLNVVIIWALWYGKIKSQAFLQVGLYL